MIRTANYDTARASRASYTVSSPLNGGRYVGVPEGLRRIFPFLSPSRLEQETESINEKEPSVMACNGQTNKKDETSSSSATVRREGAAAITAHDAAVVGLCSN